ncbi:MAG: YqgE/AlgH family protein [Alphaproteobacteria bacterium]|nr:YqgE/AlgH family protein [Alphaproteobacteria bacterium]
MPKPTETLAGQLLIAMPGMQDPRFQRTVVYLCAHSDEGAMGLVVNRLFESLTFPELLEQIGVEGAPIRSDIRVHTGGPVESGRGFVLHTADYVQEGTLVVDGAIGLTASVEILKAIAAGKGPEQSLLALGYSGWGPGQLEMEFAANGWLTVPADRDLVFAPNLEDTWSRAMAKIGVNVSMLSGEAGHA